MRRRRRPRAMIGSSIPSAAWVRGRTAALRSGAERWPSLGCCRTRPPGPIEAGNDDPRDQGRSWRKRSSRSLGTVASEVTPVGSAAKRTPGRRSVLAVRETTSSTCASRATASESGRCAGCWPRRAPRWWLRLRHSGSRFGRRPCAGRCVLGSSISRWTEHSAPMTKLCAVDR